jgi:PIN domain nuclease of toxin-antitoxin system
MRLLLDTNILLGLTPLRRPKLKAHIAETIAAGDNLCFASVASLWEIAIKTRLGKLDPEMPIQRLDGYLEGLGIGFVDIDREHVVAELESVPNTRDPFDRLLLAVCQVEGLRLVTLDRALAAHPLAWR